MAPNFIECAREQAFLMPPSVRDWLPEDHLAWFILDTVEELDLSIFYADYRDDGHGRPAHDPQMMVALLLYAYARGERSSRGIERECTEDVAYRVISANQRPDHTTIARFRQRHEGALAKLFGDLLRSCADAGLVKTGVVAIDGTKLAASASHHWNRDYEQIAREARRRLDEQRAREAKPIPRSRPERLREAKRRLEEELAVERRANAAYEAYRAGGVMRDGRRFRGPAEALRAARHARREDQHDRPRLAQPEDPARLRAGLQRPGRDE